MGIEAVVLDRDGVLSDYDVAAAAAFFKPLLPLSLQQISAAWESWGLEVGFPRNHAEETLLFQWFLG